MADNRFGRYQIKSEIGRGDMERLGGLIDGALNSGSMDCHDKDTLAILKSAVDSLD